MGAHHAIKDQHTDLRDRSIMVSVQAMNTLSVVNVPDSVRGFATGGW